MPSPAPDHELRGGPILVGDGPMARWDQPDWVDPMLVWWAVLDERYLVEVVRARDSGQLRLFDHQRADHVLFCSEVGLVGDAQFGPDIADVAAWQATAIAVVDAADQDHESGSP
jgi:hypothetical protein